MKTLRRDQHAFKLISQRSDLFFITAMCIAIFISSNSFAQSLRPMQNDMGLFDPAKGSLKIEYQLFEDAKQIEVKVLDFKGQVANRFVFVELRAGDHSFEWDGTNNNGERVVDGRYQFNILADLTNGTKDISNVNIIVATIESKPGEQIPEPLEAETHSHRIYGSLSTFYRYNNEAEDDKDNGEVRFRTGVDYTGTSSTLKGTFQALQEIEGSDTSFNGTQVMGEQRWSSGKAKAVFRDNLGNFNDPFQLFSDFQTERKKLGVTVNQSFNSFNATGVIFTSEGEVDSEEQGVAARLSYGDEQTLLIGTSFTYRNAVDEFETLSEDEDKLASRAIAVDARYGLSDLLSIVAEVVATDSESLDEDYGGGIKGEFDLGSILFSAGYTNLGENFKADFADPLHHVEGDAQGFDGSIDYFMQKPVWYFSSFSTTVRYFNLTRHSDDSTVQEVDGSFRVGIGAQDTVFMSVFNREDEFGSNSNYMANMSHKWSDTWSNLLQANYSETDNSDSLRISINTNYTQDDNKAKVSLEWTKRTIEHSKFSPYNQSYLRLDLSNELWAFQLQGKYSKNEEESGVNLFGRVDYKPKYLHRYQIVTYLSLGNRSSVETEEEVEVGVEVQF